MNTDTVTETKTTYEIKHGQPSWHQAKAGHAYAGTIVLSLTMPELAAFLAKIEARGEPHQVRRLPLAVYPGMQFRRPDSTTCEFYAHEILAGKAFLEAISEQP